MIAEAASCLALLGLIFGPLTWIKRAEIREFWSDLLREATQ